jgi:tellurite resistance protein TehA-like permease
MEEPRWPLAAQAGGPLTYSLSTLFLIVTLACVCCGLIAAAPGLGIPVAVLVAPALFRTLAETRQQQRLGEKPTAEDKIGSFFVSLTVMFGVLVAAGVAFFTACSAIGFGLGVLTRPDSPGIGVVIVLALGAGLFAALFVAILILRRTWPHRNRTKKP